MVHSLLESVTRFALHPMQKYFLDRFFLPEIRNYSYSPDDHLLIESHILSAHRIVFLSGCYPQQFIILISA